MTQEEWLASDDAIDMIQALRRFHSQDSAWLDQQLQRYFLCNCRHFWKLLPDELSRAGVEVAQRFLMGRATAAELKTAEYSAEGAAFGIDYNCYPETLEKWVNGVLQMPESELRSMARCPPLVTRDFTKELLKRAAYFVDRAMLYPGSTKTWWPTEEYRPLLSVSLLRELFPQPFAQ
jgi:hypothetical protein